MKCVKTGLRFKAFPDSGTYRGDMYYCQDCSCFVIRGIAPDVSNQEAHITLTPSPGPYGDSFTITQITRAFLKWWEEWNMGITDLTKKVIIADSRF